MGSAMELVRPRAEHLPGYLDALRRGWSPNTEHVGLDQAAIDRVTRDPDRFLELCDDREAAGDPIELPDGTIVPRLPGLSRWMWDGEFAGAINLRWQPGTTGPAAHLPGAHRLLGGPVEAPPRVRDRGPGRHAADRRRRGAARSSTSRPTWTTSPRSGSSRPTGASWSSGSPSCASAGGGPALRLPRWTCASPQRVRSGSFR